MLVPLACPVAIALSAIAIFHPSRRRWRGQCFTVLGVGFRTPVIRLKQPFPLSVHVLHVKSVNLCISGQMLLLLLLLLRICAPDSAAIFCVWTC